MANNKKIWRKVHLWLGLISAPIVFILGITGCILAFDEELENHFDSKRVQYNGQQPMVFDELLIKSQHAFSAGKDIAAVEIPNVPDRPWRFRSFREGTNEGIWYWNEKEYYESVFVDPYTSQVMVHENSEFDFFRIVLYLHWSLLFKTSIGQPIVGIATLLYLVSLMTGLYLWWPSNKKNVGKRLSFQWKESTGIKRKIYDLHNILGFHMLSIGILLSLTGLVWAFPTFGAFIQKNLDNHTKIVHQQEQDRNEIVAADKNPYQKILLYMKAEYPKAAGYVFYNTTINSDHQIRAVVRYKEAFEDIMVVADVRSGEILNTISFQDKTRGQQFRQLNYDLHLGSALGTTGKILVFIGSLISASLPLTGILIWINRGKGKAKGRK